MSRDAGPADVELPDSAGLTDSELSRRAIRGTLTGRFLYSKGMGWLAWDGQRWIPDAEAEAQHAVDLYLRGVLADTIARVLASGGGGGELKGLTSILSKSKVKAVTEMAAIHPDMRRDVADFDANPDLVNTPSGVVDLRTGDVLDHNPALLMTKITHGCYRPGYTHPDWTQALQALPDAERDWYQVRIGQAITGHPTPDGIMPVLQGSGENGKSALTTDGPVPALGDYADVASPKLVMSDRPGRSEHSTERADLRGQRLLIGEELSEGRSLDLTALKRIQDVGRIKARHVHRDNMTFDASHSLFVTTNYVPVINETDHGTWRRLALVRFPYSFRKTAGECTRPTDRIGDPTLKTRIKAGQEGQHDAIVTWAIEGARAWYADRGASLLPTDRINADTTTWRMAADRVLGFWSEHLIPEPGACILADEMLEVFNSWVKGNGHSEWSRETFAPRFGEHHETTRAGVESRRTRSLGNVSRRPKIGDFDTLKTLPNQAVVWMGVRFRTDADQQEDDERAECAEFVPNIPIAPHVEMFGNTSAHSARDTTATRTEPTNGRPSSLAAILPTDIRTVTNGAACTGCGEPLDPSLTGAGYTDHGDTCTQP